MKKLLFLTILVTIIAVIVFVGKRNNKPISSTDTPIAMPTPSENLPTTFLIDINGKSYSALLEKVEKNENLTLIPNFQERRPSKEIVLTHNCIRAINGGFYTKEYQPLGLFAVNGTVLGNERQSALTNGFFWIDESGAAHIEGLPPSDILSAPFVLQSGPLLKLEGVLSKLAIQNDEPARRMFVGINTNGSIFFFTVFDEENQVSGPYLEKLPEVIQRIEEKTGIILVKALNLDGGSASTFHTKEGVLDELALVGSLLCEKED